MTIALLATATGFAQGTKSGLDKDFGARISLTADKKIIKGLHVSVTGEARMTDDFNTLGRYQGTLGVSYKFNNSFKIGAGYSFINKKNASDAWKPRHRVTLDGTYTLPVGPWRFSLKETLQLTLRDIKNTYQNNPASLALKSRFKIAYKGFKSVTPYVYAELRTVLNDPSFKATWNAAELVYDSYESTGNKDMYVNRLRGVAGLEWKLNKRNALDFYVLSDYCYEKNIDTNSKGTVLKSLTYDRALNTHFCIGYKFSF